MCRPIFPGNFADRVNAELQTGALRGLFQQPQRPRDQNRYFLTPLDEARLRRAVKYVELNPVRAAMAARAEDYEWSSAAVHSELRGGPQAGTRCSRPVRR